MAQPCMGARQYHFAGLAPVCWIVSTSAPHFLFLARCGYRSENASAENLIQSRQMRTPISLRWRSPMLDILARCNFEPKLNCKTANDQKRHGKLKKCIGLAADVQSHTSRNKKKTCKYFFSIRNFFAHHNVGQQRVIVIA